MRPGDPRRKAAFGGRMRPPFGGAGPVYLANYADGTFTRASAATYWDGSLLTRYVTDELRLLSGGSVVLEGARTNHVLYSNDLTTGWNTYNAVIDANAETAPDGVAASAENVDFTGGATDQIWDGIATFTDNTRYAFSGFAKATAGDWSGTRPVINVLKKDNSNSDVGSWPTGAQTAWTRNRAGSLDILSGATTPRFRILNEEATDREGAFWGLQAEAGEFASSLIETSGAAATRALDDLLLPSAQVGSGLYAGSWTVIVTPVASAAEWIAAGAIGYIYYRDANNYLRVNADGKWAMAIAGNIAVQTTAGTWAAETAITLSCDIPNGDLTTSGAGNDGTFSTTGGTWGAGDIEVGQAGAGATPWYGSIGRPVAV